MKSIDILHAHNHGHKNVGDDAMANNVFRKLRAITDNLGTISTYSPPHEAEPNNDVRSLSGIINNYDNILIKITLVAMARLRMKRLYAAYAYLFCETVYLTCRLQKRLGSSWLPPGKLRNTIAALAQCRIYVRSGSGSLNDIWFWSSMYPQYTEARIAKLYGAKVYFVGQGIGPLTTSFRLKILAKFADVCDAITLRDKAKSAELLASVRPNKVNWIAVGDDAHDHPVENLPKIVSEEIRAGSYILCQFRPTDYEKTLGPSYWADIACNLEKLARQHPQYDLVAISFSTGRVNDLAAAKAINKAAGKSILRIIDYDISPGEAKSLLKGAALAIGQSYHFGVFSLAENTPFIGIYSNAYYNDKLSGLLDWYGSKHWAIRFNELHRINEVANQILKNRDSVQQSMKKTNVVLQNNINEVFKEIFA